MLADDISKLIKDIRKKNNLTQKELADKLGVTYQAVSKWENGKNIPDIEMLKSISEIFNVNFDDVLGTNKNKKKNILISVILTIIIVLIILVIFIIKSNVNSFEFKQISTSCTEFKITGSVAYNKKNSSIYISNIEFCGKNDEVYKSLECNLFEEYDNTKVRIGHFNKSENVTIKDYLKDVKFMINNYSTICKKIETSKMYIEVDAVDVNNNIKTYKIPIKMKNNCN